MTEFEKELVKAVKEVKYAITNIVEELIKMQEGMEDGKFDN